MLAEHFLRTLRFGGLPLVVVIGAICASAQRSEAAESPEVAAGRPVLSGRITDENGAPVSDARIALIHAESGMGSREARTTRAGNYEFQSVNTVGDHRLMIYSNRCLGFTRYDEGPRVALDPKKPVVRNFVLKLACQVRIQALDEEGHPVPDVQFFTPGPPTSQYPKSDHDGWATIGGLNPSVSEFTIGAHSVDFGMTRLHVKLDDPRTVVERKLVLKRGVEVKGTALCADGKPAAGWQILALPSWWDFMSYPGGEPINADGSFVLRHISPGTYNVTVSIPMGQGMSTARPALSGVDLAVQKSPFLVKVDYPSPGSMGHIEGRIRYSGGVPKRGFWVNADSEDGGGFHVGEYVRAGDKTFRIGPLPAGRYRLQFSSQEIDSKELAGISAPSQALQFDIQVRGLLSVRGTVVAGVGSPQRPLTDFRVRLLKIQTLRGSNSVPSQNWRRVNASQGQFTEELPGPGIYVVEVSAEGYATSQSEPINTDKPLPKELHIALSQGVPLSGTVVDEEGRPISGATVISVARAGGQGAVSVANLFEGLGVKTVGGRFQFAGLDPGRDTLDVVHPDYATVILPLSIKPGGQPPLTIVMQRGGTVCGHVQDHLGRLVAGATLQFQDRYSYGIDEKQGRFATAVTDENGYYEARHLPEQVIFVHRADEWEALGVVRQAVLPANGKTRTVDFGGASKVSGRLFLNGKPLANKKILIAGEDPNFGVMKAFAKTDNDGSFEFLGVPFGDRYLYYSDGNGIFDWHRVRELRIDTSSRNFGRIDHRVGSLTVSVPKIKSQDGTPIWVILEYAATGPFNGHNAGYPAPRRGKDAAYVFENVAAGKYALTAMLGEGRRVRKVIETTPDKLNANISIELPSGQASIRGAIDPAQRALLAHGWIELRAKDDALVTRAQIEDDGSFAATGLPAGEYSLTLVRSVGNNSFSEPLGHVALQAGEAKTFPVPKERVKPPEVNLGALYVTVFTPDGIPLPGCDLRLTGPAGRVLPKGINGDGRVVFNGPVGNYELAVAYIGFKPVTQPVQLKSTDGTHGNPRDHEVNVMLEPID